MGTISFRPSNAIEGEAFYSEWCEKCRREQGGRQCSIYGRTLAMDIDNPEYPKEWVSDQDGRNAKCTAFSEPRPRARRVIEDKRQVGLRL